MKKWFMSGALFISMSTGVTALKMDNMSGEKGLFHVLLRRGDAPPPVVGEEAEGILNTGGEFPAGESWDCDLQTYVHKGNKLLPQIEQAFAENVPITLEMRLYKFVPDDEEPTELFSRFGFRMRSLADVGRVNGSVFGFGNGMTNVSGPILKYNKIPRGGQLPPDMAAYTVEEITLGEQIL